MSSINKVILIGNLGRDPETRELNNGDSVVSFSLATTESSADKSTGQRKDRTEWHNIVIFNENLGKLAEQHCKKGSKVYVEGQIQTREYTDKDGNQRKVTEIVLPRFRGELTPLDSRGGSDADSAANFWRSLPMGRSERRTAGAGRGRIADIIDDKIPF
jgi:single-strand DNA-binding protein